MAARVEEGTPRLSLMGHPIQDDAHAEHMDRSSSFRSPSGRRSTFWGGFFRKRSAGGHNEDNNDPDGMGFEDSALLNTSTADMDYNARRGEDEDLDDYRDDAGDSSYRRGLLVGGSAIKDSDNEDEDDDDEDGNGWDESDKKDGSMGHSLLSNSESDEPGNNGVDFFNMHESKPVLQYSEQKEDSDQDEDSDDEDGDDDDEDEEEESSNSDEEEDEVDREEKKEEGQLQHRAQMSSMPRVAPGQPLRNFLRRTQSTTSASYSDNPQSDDGSTLDTSNRKNINGRIHGFGSEPPLSTTETTERFASARNLRQRLREMTSAYRTRKMSIGTEESLQRKSWVDRFDSVVDRVLPPDPELDGYIDAFHVRGQATVPVPHDREQKKFRQSPSKTMREPPVINMKIMPSNSDGRTMSHRRQKLGNIDDASYIIFLECELQNKELEVNSWKRRVQELEDQFGRLNCGEVDDDDDDSNSSNDHKEQEEGESEIEWQTGVAEEGQLIDVEDSTSQQRMRMQQIQDSEESSYMMLHAPDGPNGDEDYAIREKTEVTTASKEKEMHEDESFPVLPSKNHDSGTIWMDVTPSANTSGTVFATFKDQNSSDNRTDDQQQDPEDTDIDHGLEGDYEGPADGTDDEEGEDEDEEKEKEESEILQEGTLIDIDVGAHKAEKKTDGTIDTAVALVSDDDDESFNAKEDMLLDIAESPPRTMDSTLEDGSVGKMECEVSLIEIQS